VVVTVDRALLTVLLAATGLAFLQSAASSPYHEPWEWGRDTPVERARRDAASFVPGDVAVSASLKVVPPLADRRDVFTFPAPYGEEAPGDPESLGERRDDVDWVVVDTTDREDWGDATATAFEDLGDRGFEMVFEEAGVLVYRRGG
jgi:hypothetical protein